MFRNNLVIFVILSLGFHSVWADKLNWHIPNGWKIGYQKHNMVELIQVNEKLDSWTKLITIQSFGGGENIPAPSVFIAGMSKLFKSSCEKTAFIPIKDGVQNGFPFSHQWIYCSKNKQNGFGEVYQIKVIRGETKINVIQVAWRMPAYSFESVPLEKEDVVKWTKYLISTSMSK